MIRRPPRSTRTDTLFPYTTLFRSEEERPPPLARAVRRFGHPFDQIDPDGLIPQFAKAADLERRTGRFARADIQRRRPCRRRTGHRLAARRGPERKPPTGGFRLQHLRREQIERAEANPRARQCAAPLDRKGGEIGRDTSELQSLMSIS